MNDIVQKSNVLKLRILTMADYLIIWNSLKEIDRFGYAVSGSRSADNNQCFFFL